MLFFLVWNALLGLSLTETAPKCPIVMYPKVNGYEPYYLDKDVDGDVYYAIDTNGDELPVTLERRDTNWILLNGTTFEVMDTWDSFEDCKIPLSGSQGKYLLAPVTEHPARLCHPKRGQVAGHMVKSLVAYTRSLHDCAALNRGNSVVNAAKWDLRTEKCFAYTGANMTIEDAAEGELMYSCIFGCNLMRGVYNKEGSHSHGVKESLSDCIKAVRLSDLEARGVSYAENGACVGLPAISDVQFVSMAHGKADKACRILRPELKGTRNRRSSSAYMETVMISSAIVGTAGLVGGGVAVYNYVTSEEEEMVRDAESQVASESDADSLFSPGAFG